MLSQKHTISKWPNRTIEQVRSATGGQLSTADVLELLDMADGDVNRAVNMYLNKPGKVREICIIVVHVGGTCWWYSLCNFQYRSLYENTCSYNFVC